MRSYRKYSKANTCRHMRKNIGDLLVKKEYSGKSTKPICLMKENSLTTNQALARRDGKFLCKKSNGKSRHSTIHLRRDDLWNSAKGWLEMDSSSEERNPNQK